MNFIKKKKKSKKGLAADDDDFDPNLFGARQSAPEGAPEGWVPYEERLDQDSEEWAAFRQLTQRITDTVKKTQENLTKIVAESAVDEKGQNLKSLPQSASEDEPYSGDLHLFNGQSQKPARPPPPKPSKPPPRPPPVARQPPVSEGVSCDTFASAWDSLPAKAHNQGFIEEEPFDLDKEFGFGQPVPVRSYTSHGRTGSLFLDDEDEEELDGDDPFDTSFVDATADIVQSQKTVAASKTTQEDLFNNNWEEEEEEDDPFIVKDLPDCALMDTDTNRVKAQNPFLADFGVAVAQPQTNKPPSRPASRPQSRPPSTNPFIDDDDEDDYVAPTSSSNPFAMAIAQMAEPFEFLNSVDANDEFTYKAPEADLLGLGFDEPSPSPSPPPLLPQQPIMPLFHHSEPFDPFGEDSQPIDTATPNPFAKHDAPPEPEVDLMASDEIMVEHGGLPSITMDKEGGLDPFLTPVTEDAPRDLPQPFLDRLTTPFAVAAAMDMPSPCMSEQPDAGEAHDAFDAFFASPAKVSAGATTVSTDRKTLCYAPSEDWGDLDDVEPSYDVSSFPAPPPPPTVQDTAFSLDWGHPGNFDTFGSGGFITESKHSFKGGMDVVNPWGDSSAQKGGGAEDLFSAFGEPAMASNGSVDLFGQLDDVTKESLGEVDGEVAVPIVSLVGGEQQGGSLAADFDAFEAKFCSANAAEGNLNAFGDFGMLGSGTTAPAGPEEGFGALDEFDSFLSLREPPAAPKPSPARPPPPSKVKPQRPSSAAPKPLLQTGGEDSSDSDSDDGGPDFSVFIRPKMRDPLDIERDASAVLLEPLPLLPPPPVAPPKSPNKSPPGTSPTPRFNPFDKSGETMNAQSVTAADAEFDLMFGFTSDVGRSEVVDSSTVVLEEKSVSVAAPPPDLPDLAKKATSVERTESQESAGSPLYDEDDTEPLADFYPKYEGDGWEMMLRHPNKKKLTGQRFWKKVFLRLHDHTVLQLFNKADDKEPFQELPLQACYVLSEVGAQQYDAYGKIFTVKLQYIFYRERVGVRPAQISKVAQKQVTTFGQLAKLGLPLEHAPQVSQLLKLGTQSYNDMKVFQREIEDSLFRLNVHRDRALTYRTEEVQVNVHDELYAEVNRSGTVLEQRARVRVFFLAFLSGMPDVEIGVNDVRKKGREVVGRHDIIPVITEEWIRVEKVEFHSCVGPDEFEKSRTVKFHPPDACFFELLRYRVRPPRNRELPLQVKVAMSVVGAKVEIRCDVLVPGYVSKRHGQVPCEDVAIRFPLPECWIYLFRSEKHFRYGSIKSAARKPGKIKGLERIMGAASSHDTSLIEVSTGAAKYEHQHRAIVWRVARLPKDGQGAYTTQLFICRLELTSYDQIPAEYEKYVDVEFIMPATTVSHTTIRSVSVSSDNPPEKYVRYVSKHEYRVEIDHVTETSECEYVAATNIGIGTDSSKDSTTTNNLVTSKATTPP